MLLKEEENQMGCTLRVPQSSKDRGDQCKSYSNFYGENASDPQTEDVVDDRTKITAEKKTSVLLRSYTYWLQN